MIQSHQNNVIVSIKTKYIRNFSKILRMAAIQNNTSIEPSDYVNIIGEVVSSPLSISNRREYKNFSQEDIKVGDTVIFSHEVIANTIQTEPEAEPIYKNMFWYKGNEYWTVKIDLVYAVIRDGEIRMQNGYVMLEELEAESKIILQADVKRKIRTGSGTVSNVGEGVNLKQGDVVYFNPNQLRHYQINERPFGILTQKQILGKKRKEKAALVL